jgi:monoamine oxidase
MMPVGKVVKLALHFRSRFWAEGGRPDVVFLHTPESPFLAWWTAQPSEAPLLTGWSGGPRAATLSNRRPEEVLETGLATLSETFGRTRDDLTSSLAGWKVFDWQADPHSRGAYSYVPAGGRDLPRQIAAPIADTLFFAGEAMHVTLMGTVAGAIATGVRAAEEILQALA